MAARPSPEELASERDYYLGQLDELTAANLRLASDNAALRHQLHRELQRAELASEMQAELRAFHGLPALFESTLALLHRRLALDRALVLEPEPDQGCFRPSHWLGYPAEGPPSDARLRLSPEQASATCLVNQASAASALAAQVREALGLPYFVLVPALIDSRPFAVLVAGRLKEARNLIPPLDEGDVASVSWAAQVLAASVRMMRIAALEERDRWRTQLQDLERSHLAQDLHDAVGSSLSLLGLYGDLVEAHAGEPARLREVAASLRETGQQGAGELRGVLAAMSGEAASVDGLAEALHRLGRRLTDGGGARLEVSVRAGGEVELEGGHRLALTRVFQEAVANALRHGKARQVTATLWADAARVGLEVCDDGQGFHPAAPRRPGSLGLTGMQRRAADLQGELAMEAAPGRGTRVTVRIPRLPAREGP